MSRVSISIDQSGSFRVYLTETTDMVQTAADIHATTPLATAGLGRVLTGAGLMCLQLKKPTDRLTVIFRGDGPAKQILAAATGNGDVKGYISNPDVDLPLKGPGKLDVGGSLGIGELTVIKDMGLKEPYSGTIALVSGEIAEDLTAYHYISEQQNTAISLGVKIGTDTRVEGAAGLFIQMLPGAEEGAIEALEALLSDLPPITTSLDEARKVCEEEPGTDILAALGQQIFGGLPPAYALRKLEEREIRWHCGCSKERMAKALMAIGRKDLTEILMEDGETELSCQFCGTRYRFSGEELEDLLAQM